MENLNESNLFSEENYSEHPNIREYLDKEFGDDASKKLEWIQNELNIAENQLRMLETADPTNYRRDREINIIVELQEFITELKTIMTELVAIISPQNKEPKEEIIDLGDILQ